ncbi:hypothetical protein CICLE_v10007581mg [Citrus x clementina]|uniref:Ubiquitin-like domain-containing protein n=2 Tax=Citrus clementina TaxID=85681 RepID=V4UW68_CITCL|nr:ubiquitin-like domain-containing protein CIP73 isoform X1 [Citrus sinensis]ESR66961.1 hypothetical protein CICLE_v10007581mg [Citrus x clementina]
MESRGTVKIPGAESSETTIEIKIKTLDSQTYTLRVDKQVPVPALKEQIASVTGVLSEQQRLICRGKVLKDDQLLSAYHVEDGHTLHMVVRQPVTSSSDGTHNLPGTSRSHGSHVAPSVVIETFNLPDRGDGVPSEISQIVSAVLGSFGLSNIGSGGGGIDLREHAMQRPERTSDAGSALDSAHQQPEQGGTRFQSNRPHSAFGIPTAISLGTLQPPVIPDSLTTLSQYLSQLRHEFDGIGSLQEGLPMPASLAEVMQSTRQMLIEQSAECLHQLARQLENQANVTDPSLRTSIQTTAWSAGLLLHNLGAFLLELGRTTMTLRLGQTPSEAVVNAGPAVFISPSGPNPLMVQPLPFQPGTSFGAIPMGSVQPGSGLVNGRSAGFLPRRIDIQIRRGSSMVGSNAIQEERSNTQQAPGQGNTATASGTDNLGSQATTRNSDGSSSAGESGVRVVPIRTMVAAVPAPFGRLPSDSSSNPVSLYYPVLGRFQHVASGLVSGEQGHQVSGEHHPAGLQTEQPSVPDSIGQQNAEDPARNGSLANPNSRQQEASHSHSVNVGTLSTAGTQDNQESERQIRSGVLQLLRNLFPGGEIHVENGGLHGTASDSVPEHAATFRDRVVSSTGSSAAEASATDEGIFLSNLLHQIMPFISQHSSAEPTVTPLEDANAFEHRMSQDSSTHAGSSSVRTSRRQSDSEPSAPNPKRQKME